MADKTVLCPNCNLGNLDHFYSVPNVPVHSVLLMDTKDEALSYPKGDINLGFCKKCGFISNSVFDASKHEYSERYEETQEFSETFNKFQKSLAKKLIDKHQLFNKEIIEIGSGKGQFLSLLCEYGDNTGYGFDPAYIPERNKSKVKDKVTFITDFYSEKYSDYKGDFICCKMTLEHIPDTLNFLNIVRRSIGDQTDSLVFFQIPDTTRILEEFGFWDIYYEHCSYFTPLSLANLFTLSNFEILEVYTDYDDQYLMIEAKPKSSDTNAGMEPSVEVKDLYNLVEVFSQNINSILSEWKDEFNLWQKEEKKVILWGGGSKAVAFLTTLNISEQVEEVVDINPYKHNTYLAGTGQKIVGPDDLRQLKPDVVIIMNPIYTDEISMMLNDMDLNPVILPITYKHSK